MGAHESCPDCGKVPQSVFNYLGKWYVRCRELACHNVTRPAESPEEAWKVWDGWARRMRLRERGEQDRADTANLGKRTLCRLCGKPIQWTLAADGRLMPFDVLEDGGIGESHFKTCEKYDRQAAEEGAA